MEEMDRLVTISRVWLDGRGSKRVLIPCSGVLGGCVLLIARDNIVEVNDEVCDDIIDY